MKEIPEKEVTKQIRRLLKSIGVFHWKQIGALGLPKGISDILGIYEGRFLAIEVKRPGGRLSQYQKEFLKRVRDEGGIAIVARSVDDVIDGLGIRDRFLF